jgi:hypothetical protein
MRAVIGGTAGCVFGVVLSLLLMKRRRVLRGRAPAREGIDRRNYRIARLILRVLKKDSGQS